MVGCQLFLLAFFFNVALRCSVVWCIICPSQAELCFCGFLTFPSPRLYSSHSFSHPSVSGCHGHCEAESRLGLSLGALMKGWLTSEREKKWEWRARGSRLSLHSFAPSVSDAHPRTHRLYCSRNTLPSFSPSLSASPLRFLSHSITARSPLLLPPRNRVAFNLKDPFSPVRF